MGFCWHCPRRSSSPQRLGWLLERGLIRFLYKRQLDTLLATWGVGLILEQAAKNIFGAPNVNVEVPEWLTGSLDARRTTSRCPTRALFILGLAVLALAGVGFYLFRTSTGRLVRAVMQNRAMADCLGVRTDQIDAATFALGTGLAGLAGAALCLLGRSDRSSALTTSCRLSWSWCWAAPANWSEPWAPRRRSADWTPCSTWPFR